MKRTAWFVLLLAVGAACARGEREESLDFARFGTVALYEPSALPSHVALFVSGDAGWSGEVVEMARALAALDTLVVGVDITRYLKQLGASWDQELYPEADFEALSQYTQKKLELSHYIPPVLVGYGSGAAFVYATLVQAAPNTFRGAVSLAFCPDLVLPKPLGREYLLDWRPTPDAHRYALVPAVHLAAPWIVLQGGSDTVCGVAATQAFVKQVGHGQLVVLPDVGHQFVPNGNSMPQLRKAFIEVAATTPAYQMAQAAEVNDLPLVEVAATGPPKDMMAVILSGDGGWASIDRTIGEALASQGVAVVGLNSLEYFWTRRTPEGAAKDLERIVRHYLASWHKQEAMLIGYSRGADVLPFMANRLPKALLSAVPLIVLMGPGLSVSFEFHLTDWLWDVPRRQARPILPEVEKLRGMKILCVYGEDEKETLCKKLDPDLATTLMLPGAHHFGGNYDDIVRRVLDEATNSQRPASMRQ